MAEALKEWLTAQEVAALKGVRVQTVTKAIREGRLPAQRRGHGYLVHRPDAEQWTPRRP